MIPLLDKYEMATPASLREALDDLAQHPDARPFAGGTDLMVVLEAGHLPPGRYVSLQNCRELLGVEEETGGGVAIGALTTYTEIRNSALLGIRYPMLPLAASETGGLATQNRGTIGGNIANASPAADTPPALLVYDAELELMSSSGTRWVPYQTFHTGYKTMIMQPDELLAHVRLPRLWPDLQHYYRKVGTRKAQAISKVCLAATARVKEGTVDHLRIALGSIAPIPLRCLKTEEELRGKSLDENIIEKAKAVLGREIVPIDDIRSTKSYRSRVSLNLLEDFLRQLIPVRIRLH